MKKTCPYFLENERNMTFFLLGDAALFSYMTCKTIRFLMILGGIEVNQLTAHNCLLGWNVFQAI